MSTLWTKDGDDLQRLIDGDDCAWRDLQADWHDKLADFASNCWRRDWEKILGDAWGDVVAAVSKWKPGIDMKLDKKTKTEVPIHTALTAAYVKRAIRNRAIREGRVQEGSDGSPMVRLDAPCGAVHEGEIDQPSLAAQAPDRPDRGQLIESDLVELIVDIHGAFDPCSDEQRVRGHVVALTEEGLLIQEALDLMIQVAAPPLTPEQHRCMTYRWILEKSFLETGRELHYRDQAVTGSPSDRDVTNWANNQHQGALRRIRDGLQTLGVQSSA